MGVKLIQGLVGRTLEPISTATPSVSEQAQAQTQTTNPQLQSQITTKSTEAAVVSLRYSGVAQSASRGERLTLEKAERTATDIADRVRGGDEEGTKAHKPDATGARGALS